MDFQSTYASHPRYQHLVNLSQQYAAPSGTYAGRNNDVITTRISKLNPQRLVRLYRGPFPYWYGATKFLVAFLLSRCLEDFPTIPKSAYLPPESLSLIPDSYQMTMRCTHDTGTFDICTYDVLFNNLGYNTSNWPTSRFPSSNRGLAVPNLATDPKSAFLYWLVVEDTELAPYFDLSSNCTAPEYIHDLEHLRSCTASVKVGPSGYPASCQNLAAEANQRLDDWSS